MSYRSESMTGLRNHIGILSVLTAGACIVLSVVVVILRPAIAHTSSDPTCSTGIAVPDPANNPGLVSDCEALLASRDTLAGDATLNWSAAVPMEDWDGITLGGTPQRVTQLRLSWSALTGTIPSELGSLTNLQWLRLSSNQLSGEIPVELGNLANLRLLNLHANPLTGEIPVELGNLTNLVWLDLSSNELTGTIPGELGSLTNLQGLDLWNSQLIGDIPSELAGLTNLRHLRNL